MANPYPALITDANAETRIAGQINFTDPANQPGGGATRSFLSTSNAANSVTLPSGSNLALVWDYPADGEHGSDITIDAGGTTFTLVNDGIYSMLMSVDLSVTLADIASLRFNGTFDAQDPWRADSTNGWPGLDLPFAAGSGGKYLLPIPATWFTGGDFFTLTGRSSLHDMNVSLDSAIFLISRIL